MLVSGDLLPGILGYGGRSGEGKLRSGRTRVRPVAHDGSRSKRAHQDRRVLTKASAQMSSEDLEKYEAEMELQLYREYRDVVGLFSYVVETERRFYLTNHVDLQPRSTENGEMYFEVVMEDAWVWDMYRPARFVRNVRVVTFKDVNVEEITKSDLELPPTTPGGG